MEKKYFREKDILIMRKKDRSGSFEEWAKRESAMMKRSDEIRGSFLLYWWFRIKAWGLSIWFVWIELSFELVEELKNWVLESWGWFRMTELKNWRSWSGNEMRYGLNWTLTVSHIINRVQADSRHVRGACDRWLLRRFLEMWAENSTNLYSPKE